MEAKLKEIRSLLVTSVEKIDAGMPFTARVDVLEALSVLGEVLTDINEEENSRDNW